MRCADSQHYPRPYLARVPNIQANSPRDRKFKSILVARQGIAYRNASQNEFFLLIPVRFRPPLHPFFAKFLSDFLHIVSLSNRKQFDVQATVIIPLLMQVYKNCRPHERSCSPLLTNTIYFYFRTLESSNLCSSTRILSISLVVVLSSLSCILKTR